MHIIRIAVVGAVLSLWASNVHAQTGGASRLGTSGQLAIGVERVFGFVSSTASTEDMGVEVDVTLSTFGLGFRQGMSAYSVPRVALDGFVADGWSLGGSLGFSTTSVSVGGGTGGTSASLDVGSVWMLVLAPRAGYAHAFNETLGLWPRAGFTVYFGSGSPDTGIGVDLDGDGVPDTTGQVDVSLNGVALSLDVPLVITPTPHVAFLIGPALDLGITGTTSTEAPDAMGVTTTVDQDVTVTDIAIHAGIVVWW